MKEILIAMNEKSNFIIEDLDDYHLVIKADEEYRVRRELEVEVCASLDVVFWVSYVRQLEKNTYSLEA